MSFELFGCRVLGYPQVSSPPRVVVGCIAWNRPQSSLLTSTSLSGSKKHRQANPAGLLGRGVSLFFAGDLAYGVLSFADAAANVTLSLLGLALAFEMTVAERLAGFLFIVPVPFSIPRLIRCRSRPPRD